MNEVLDNGVIRIAVAAHGAELCSLRRGEREYLWHGDPAIWARHSPVLFPIVGKVWEGRYRVMGEEFRLPQHGFARDMDFRLESRGDSRIAYVLESTAETLAKYPFPFRLTCGYELRGSSVVVSWRVENTGQRLMPFQIGAHPALMLPPFDAEGAEARGYFDFDSPAPLRFIHPTEGGCASPETLTLCRDSGQQLRIDAHAFAPATYIFEGGQLRRVSILDRQKRPYVSVSFQAPLVALWAPVDAHPECPFVCIEPWYGRCDYVGYEGDFASRPWTQHLRPGEEFRAEYAITVD